MPVTLNLQSVKPDAKVCPWKDASPACMLPPGCKVWLLAKRWVSNGGSHLSVVNGERLQVQKSGIIGLSWTSGYPRRELHWSHVYAFAFQTDVQGMMFIDHTMHALTKMGVTDATLQMEGVHGAHTAKPGGQFLLDLHAAWTG